MNLVTTLDMESSNPNFHAMLERFCTKKSCQLFLAYPDGKIRDMALNILLILDQVSNNLYRSRFHFLMVFYDTKCMETPFVCIHPCKVRHKLLDHILTLYWSLHWHLCCNLITGWSSKWQTKKLEVRKKNNFLQTIFHLIISWQNFLIFA